MKMKVLLSLLALWGTFVSYAQTNDRYIEVTGTS